MRYASKVISTAAMVCTLSYGSLSQVLNTRYPTLESLIEVLSEESEEDADISLWLEELHFLAENPIDINLASEGELRRIPFLNEITAASILAHRERSGAFKSVFEVASVIGIGRDLAEKLSFFIVAGDDTADLINSWKSSGRAQHQLLAKGWQSFPKQAGYLSQKGKPPAFQGEPQKIYTRYLFRQGTHLQVGVTGDRDPGEQFFKGSNPLGFDFYSAHVSFKYKDAVPQVIIGDFSARAGQGLVIWQGFSMGKTAEVMQVSKTMSMIRPYTSTDENFFLRGIATTLQSGDLRAHLFLSHKKSDGNLLEGADGKIIFTSLQSSGYHRTLSEIEDKNRVGHSVAGALLGLTSKKLRFGANILYERFQYPYVRGTQLYQKFLFSGRENYNASLDYKWISGPYQLYGEAAVSKSGGIALIQGWEGRMHDQLTMAMVFRHYEKDYHATWASAFGENNRAINETGIYAGLRTIPASGVTLSGYADWFWSPWINYATSGPSRGFEYMVQGDFRYSRKLDGYIRFKNKSRADKVKGDQLYFDDTGSRTSLRWHISYKISDRFYLRSRLENVLFSYPDSEKGILLFQDFGWTPSQPELSLNARFSWFRTGGYNARIYTYENDLLYNFSTFAFFGEGIRIYLNMRYRFSNSLDGWFKIARTAYSDRDVISSGHSRIEGNSKAEVKIQFRYRF
jgi:hypothetical protein